MFDFSQVKLQKVVVHDVGNKTREEELTLSPSPLPVDHQMLKDLLLTYFLHPFKETSLYNLTHDDDLRLNEVYTYIANIFEDKGSFYDMSCALARHLYDKSEHPKIKSGEFYLVYFEECVLEDEVADAIGIFKSEHRDTFLKVEKDDEGFKVGFEKGININRLDKGCLIFNIDKDKGYVAAIVDASNKNEAVFWKDDFLRVKPREDHFYYTQNFLSMCNEFIEETHVPEEKPEVVEMQKKTLQFFKEEKVFDVQKFEEEVLQEPEKIEHFRTYKKEFEEKTQTPMPEDFKISTPAVKTAKKQFKNTLKLDGNFVVQVLNNNAVMKRGFDEKSGMKYYQLFFNAEE